MVHNRPLVTPASEFRPFLLLTCLVLLSLLTAYACKSHSHTSDSRLQKIDDLLNAGLPPGTPRSRVEFFLSSRGYSIEHSHDKNSLAAVVRHVDTDTLQPATARVTFHFDSNDKLLSYDLQSAPDTPLRP
jgi:hypothetical protein